VKLPRVKRMRKRGKLYRYHRPTGTPLPSDCPEDHPRFIAAWTAAEAGRTEAPAAGPRPGSVGAACIAYLRSEHYLAHSEGYCRVLRRHVEAIRAGYGAASLRALAPEHIRADLARLSAHPARSRRKAWRALLGWAVAAGLLKSDPSDGVKAPRAPQTRGHLPWTADQIEAVRARWPVGEPRRLAVELLYWTGARISDAVRLGPGMIGRDGLLTYTQSKTGEPASVPWRGQLPPFCDAQDHAHLMACLDAAPKGMLFLTTRTGAPRSVKAFGSWVAETATLAGVDRSAHGLRKSRMIDLAERGAPSLAMQAWCGHLTLDEVQHYIREAERRKSLRGTEQDRNPVNHPDPVDNRGAK
jgi:integrase